MKSKTLKDVKSFTVDRKTWYRGKSGDSSCLLNNAGNRCCLGFYASACGVEDKQMRNLLSPGSLVELAKTGSTYDKFDRSVSRDVNEWKTKLTRSSSVDNSETCMKMMQVNDEEKITEEVREKKLTALFASIGIKIKFVG